MERKKLFIGSLLVGLIASACIDPIEAFAQESAGQGRRLWNNLMLWVNFGIMVFIFIRYARKPLMNYLHSVRKKLEDTLGEVDTRMTAVKSVAAEENEKLKGIDGEIREIHEKVLEMAQGEKEKIVESGRVAAEKMIENAKAYAEYRLAVARKAVFDEMVDLAVSMAEEKLKEGISKEDGERLLADFLKHLETSRPRLMEKAV